MFAGVKFGSDAKKDKKSKKDKKEKKEKKAKKHHERIPKKRKKQAWSTGKNLLSTISNQIYKYLNYSKFMIFKNYVFHFFCFSKYA